jgi:hypothetical protein
MAEPLLRPATPLEDESDLELITLDLICLSTFGPSYLKWEYETIKFEVQEKFGNMGEITWQKIQAAVLLHSSTSCWSEWEVFEKVVAACMGEFAIFSYAQPPEPEDMAIALTVMARISETEISDEVASYVAAACLYDGLWVLEAPLDVGIKSIADLDKQKNIERDYSSVKDVLEKHKRRIDNPSGMAEAQANRVFLVREAVRGYNKKVSKELLRYKHLLKGGINV